MRVFRTIASGICFVAAPVGALACTCAFHDSPLAEQVEAAVLESDVVAEVEIVSTSVEVVSREESGRKWSWDDKQYHDYTEVVNEPKLVAQVNVLRYWKGEPHALVAVRTETAWQACGVGLRPGQRLLLYARSAESDHAMETGTCTRTKAADEASEEIRVLDLMRHRGAF